MTKKAGIRWTVVGMAALAFDAVVVFSVTPLAIGAMKDGTAGALLTSGTSAFHTVAAVGKECLVRYAGDGLVAAARNAALAYTTVLRLTPQAAQQEVEGVECRTLVCPAGARMPRVRVRIKQPVPQWDEAAPSYGPNLSFGPAL